MSTDIPSPDALSKRYHDAVNELVWQLTQDEQVLAVLLEGSLAHDQVWQRSDVDMLIVVKDQKLVDHSRTLLYQDVLFSISVAQRSEFIKAQNSALTGSFRHSLISLGKLLFLRDENLRPFFDLMGRVGEHDRQIQYLFAASEALFMLDKAEKWLTVKHDPLYAYHWLTGAAREIGTLIVLQAGEVPRREVLQQAEKLDPETVKRLYREPCDLPKTQTLIQSLLDEARGYIHERAGVFFASVLDVLRQAEDACAVSELEHRLGKQVSHSLSFTLEHCLPFLCEIGLLEAVTLPIHLTPRSRPTVDEAAYILTDPH